LFDRKQFFTQVGELLGGCGGNFMIDKLLVSDDGCIDLGLRFAIPFGEGWFGDAEPASDSGKAQASNTKPQEFVVSRGGMHGISILDAGWSI